MNNMSSISTIEKALRRARGELYLVPTQEPHEPVIDNEIPVPDYAGLNPALELRELDDSVRTRYRIIYPELGHDATVQAFRELRTRILKKTQGRSCIVLVTSVTAQGGGSFVALNLSVAFAFDAGKSALLMDCNLRNPMMHGLCSGSNVRGLTDYLENSAIEASEIIHPVGIERLRVIPAGNQCPAPSEFFTSVKMRQLLETLRRTQSQPFVIIDGPPVNADSQILAELCDYVLMVVPYGKVTSTQLEHCIQTVDREKLLGVVFNDEPVVPWKEMRSRPVAAAVGAQAG
ncbi:MAG: polysaccharide biosynthesis protein [Gammaproteobacteria bacterium]|nr:polysaccharide biosynthesis protein [Gammaproteobacteria bacterium]